MLPTRSNSRWYLYCLVCLYKLSYHKMSTLTSDIGNGINTYVNDQVGLMKDPVVNGIMILGVVVAVVAGIAVWHWQSSKCSSKDDPECGFHRDVWTMGVVFVVFVVFGIVSSYSAVSRGHGRALVEDDITNRFLPQST